MDDTPVAALDHTVMAPAEIGPDALGSGGGRARLRVVQGPNLGVEFLLEGHAIVLGRGVECDLMLEDPAVSRRHVRVVVAGEQLLGEDLDSGNGTFVGGVKVARFNLLDGMQFRVGATHILFQIDAESRPEVPAPSPIAVGTPPSLRVPRDPVAHGGVGKARWVVRGLVLGTTLAVLIGWLLVWLLRPTTSSSALVQASADLASAAVHASGAPGADSAEALRRAQQAIAARDWAAALAHLDEVTGQAPAHPGLDGLRARARDERRNGQLLERARQAMASEDGVEDAAAFLSRIDDSSVYHEESRRLLGSIERQRIHREVQEVRRLLEIKDHRATRDAYLALLRRYPEDEEVLSLKPLVKVAFAPAPARPHARSPGDEPQELRSRLGEIHAELAREAVDRGDCEAGRRHAREALTYRPDDEVARRIEVQCGPAE